MIAGSRFYLLVSLYPCHRRWRILPFSKTPALVPPSLKQLTQIVTSISSSQPAHVKTSVTELHVAKERMNLLVDLKAGDQELQELEWQNDERQRCISPVCCSVVAHPLDHFWCQVVWLSADGKCPPVLQPLPKPEVGQLHSKKKRRYVTVRQSRRICNEDELDLYSPLPAVVD
jgi:hypothetical protein